MENNTCEFWRNREDTAHTVHEMPRRGNTSLRYRYALTPRRRVANRLLWYSLLGLAAFLVGVFVEVRL